LAKRSHLSELRNLLGRCNNTTVEILLEATSLCRRLGHVEILLEHVLDGALGRSDIDFVILCRHFNIAPDELLADVRRVLSEKKAIGTPRPPMSEALVEVLERAWQHVSIPGGRGYVRSGDLFWAMATMESDSVSRPIRRLGEATRREELEHDFAKLVAHSSDESGPVEGQVESVEETGSKDGRGEPLPSGDGLQRSATTGYIKKYCTNFTELAEEGGIDPIFGRDAEIREVIDILARRRKNNPILVGEPGVGKTAIVEGLALRIAQGDAPAHFANFQVVSLDLGLLQAGASMKGEFEKRLKGVINEIKHSPVPTIFFIDEAHTLVGAGAQAGGGDAANLLKPALARGELRSIAATTWSEYKQYFETDPALTRRFQLIHVKEPSSEDAKTMLRGLRSKYEDAHGIRILDNAVGTAVDCAKRYLSGRFLPDSAIDLIDTSAAKVKNVLESRPASIDQLERELGDLEVERHAVEREVSEGRHIDSLRLKNNERRRTEITEELEKQRTRWKQERTKVDAIHEALRRLGSVQERADEARRNHDHDEAADIENNELRDLRESMGRAIDELKELQGDSPLLHAEVDEDTVLSVVEEWTGVPVQRMGVGDASNISNFEQHLRARIRGQKYAVQAVSEIVKAHKAGISDPNKPIGVFLCLGPSGVGKTEIALAVADLMFGGEAFVTKINMSEYSSGFSESRLIGAPPGYKGYGKGGVLTEAVRQKPYSVVLLDEVDRADQQVWNLFYSPFEKGEMNDGEGKLINFRNTAVFLTSNLGSEAIMRWAELREQEMVNATGTDSERQEPEAGPAKEQLVDSSPPSDSMAEQLTFEAITEYLKDEAAKVFTMPLLARMTLLPFIPLDEAALQEIACLKLDKLKQRLAGQRQLDFAWEPALPEWIVSRCRDAGFGARLIDQIIQSEIQPKLTNELLHAMAHGGTSKRVWVSLSGNGADATVNVELIS